MIKSLHYSYCLSILSKINTKHYKFFTRNIIEIEEKTNNKLVTFVLLTCWPYTIQGTYWLSKKKKKIQGTHRMSPLHHMAWLNKTVYIFVFTSILEKKFCTSIHTLKFCHILFYHSKKLLFSVISYNFTILSAFQHLFYITTL